MTFAYKVTKAVNSSESCRSRFVTCSKAVQLHDDLSLTDAIISNFGINLIELDSITKSTFGIMNLINH